MPLPLIIEGGKKQYDAICIYNISGDTRFASRNILSSTKEEEVVNENTPLSIDQLLEE